MRILVFTTAKFFIGYHQRVSHAQHQRFEAPFFKIFKASNENYFSELGWKKPGVKSKYLAATLDTTNITFHLIVFIYKHRKN